MPVAEGTITPAVSEQVALEDLKPGTPDYAAWRKTGDLPAKPVTAAPVAEAVAVDPKLEVSSGDDEPPVEPRDRRVSRLKVERAKFRDEARTAAAENARLREELEQARKAKEAPGPAPEVAAPAVDDKKEPEKPKADASVRPQLQDFQDTEESSAWDQWQEALIDWRADQRIAAAEAKRDAERAAKEEAAAKATKDATEAETRSQQELAWFERAQPFVEQYENWKEVALNPEIPLNGVMDVFIGRDPLGAGVLYLLGSDLKRAAEIAAMDPMESHEAMIELRQTLRKPQRESGEPKPDPPKPPTPRAAKPIVPIAGRSAAPEDPVDAALNKGDAGLADYLSARNARDAARKR
jgi:hypothetical protein